MSSKKVKVTLYHMAGCGACKKISPIWNKIKTIYTNVEFKDIELNQIPENKKNIIDAFPTIIIEKDGEEVETIIGCKEQEEIEDIINKYTTEQTGGRRKVRKTNKKTSRKASKKTSKKKTRKTSRKLSRKTSKKASRKYKK